MSHRAARGRSGCSTSPMVTAPNLRYHGRGRAEPRNGLDELESPAPATGQTISTSWPSSTPTRPTENGARVNAEYTAPAPVTDESTRVSPDGAAASLAAASRRPKI